MPAGEGREEGFVITREIVTADNSTVLKSNSVERFKGIPLMEYSFPSPKSGTGKPPEADSKSKVSFTLSLMFRLKSVEKVISSISELVSTAERENSSTG